MAGQSMAQRDSTWHGTEEHKEETGASGVRMQLARRCHHSTTKRAAYLMLLPTSKPNFDLNQE